MMTTVAMPVFSKKKETLSHGILLGVVGTDIPLVEVMMLAPRYKVRQETHIVPGTMTNPVITVVLMQCVFTAGRSRLCFSHYKQRLYSGTP